MRLAIGAQRWQLGRLVAVRSFAVVLAGVAAGGVATLWTSALLESLLYGVSPHDSATVTSAATAVAVAAAAAVAVPVLRAMRVDPAETLRSP